MAPKIINERNKEQHCITNYQNNNMNIAVSTTVKHLLAIGEGSNR
jgi:hypothetical protein